jgi:formamidopyrimidine-DNA glycosylase
LPEGHSVRRQATRLLRVLGGRRVRASSPQGRFAEGARLLDGRVLRSTDAHGKHLFAGFATSETARPDRWLHVHLGLYGVWLEHDHDPAEEPEPPRGAVRLRLTAGSTTADLRGPTACEVLTAPQVRDVHGRLGADPLRRDADPEAAWQRLRRSRTPVGALLMQQDLVAGVGNVYRAEVLFRAGLDPHRPGSAVDRETWDRLWADLVALMRAGVRAGRIVTTRPEHRSRRSGPASREDAHYVYRRTGLPCRLCGTPVVAEPFVARTLYRCPVCQAA